MSLVTTRTVSQAMSSELSSLVDIAFGVVGNGNAHLVDALIADGVSFTPTRHEAGAVAAADAFARKTGLLAIATTTYGPGFTNALTPLAEAVAARSPLLLVTGAPPASPRPWDIDQAACARAVGADVVRVGEAGVAGTIRAAARNAQSQNRPVVIEVPYDIATRSVVSPDSARSAVEEFSAKTSSSGLPQAAFSTPAMETLTRVSAAATLLAGASRPLVVAGAGAIKAGIIPELEAVARALGAATATTAVARGAFSNDVPSLGVIGGFANSAVAAALAAADVVLVVGASLNPFSSRFGTVFGDAQVVRVDHDPGSTQVPVTQSLIGDAAALVPALREAISSRGALASAWGAAVARGIDTRPETPPSEFASDGRLDPRAVAQRLSEILPARVQLVQDIGHSISWAPRYLPPTPSLPPIFMGSAFQSTGLGLLGAIGACAASAGELTLAAMGDGSALMALADLDTIARSQNRCVVLVWNDAAYSAEVLQYADAQGLNPAPMLIDEVDFAAAAHAVGGRGTIIRSLADLSEFQDWVDKGVGLFLLDCRVSRLVEASFMSEITASVVRHDTQRIQ